MDGDCSQQVPQVLSAYGEFVPAGSQKTRGGSEEAGCAARWLHCSRVWLLIAAFHVKCGWYMSA